jgi:hypothetical protein
MAATSKGTTKLALPIVKAVGAQHSPQTVNQAAAAPAVSVPGPQPIIINGVTTAPIDVRNMSATDVVNTINNANITGVTASLGGDGSLLISGEQSIGGDPNLRAILGI